MTTPKTFSAETSLIIDRAIEQYQLPDSYRQLIAQYLLPLSQRIEQAYQHKQSTLVVGINGGQGSGKSTLCVFLKILLKHVYKLPSVILSIDDFYLSKTDRAVLAKKHHPLLQTRGVPGTHNITLVIDTVKALVEGRQVLLPQFNKAEDDCVAKQHWPLQQQAVNIVLLEGWCVGAQPQDESMLATPINQLERDEDGEGCWRQYVNQQLAGEYQQLFSLIDLLIMLKVPNMNCVYEWRGLQEKKLAKNTEGRRDGIMDKKKLQRFINHYERLTKYMLEEMPQRADVVLNLTRSHGIDGVKGINAERINHDDG